MEKNVRLRVLYVMELFVQQTDAENGVTMQEILDWLADHNLTGERKSIYEDIHALKEFGCLPISEHTNLSISCCSIGSA